MDRFTLFIQLGNSQLHLRPNEIIFLVSLNGQGPAEPSINAFNSSMYPSFVPLRQLPCRPVPNHSNPNGLEAQISFGPL